MISQILTHTPVWVWILLVALCAVGLQQTRDRNITLPRLLILPIAMLIFSASSLPSKASSGLQVFSIWLASVTIFCSLGLISRTKTKHRYDAVLNQFFVAGSWFPLALIFSMFIAKYSAAVTFAIRPDWALDATFSASFAALFGAINAGLLVRVVRIIALKRAYHRLMADQINLGVEPSH
ncbi:DUF6622 family protein [Undibacterium fentianense]|uniref:Transmembrane protein n=1 Tax=Undibacterium fentianense TaxID=2828728 RepID=A0A941II01_9BURK|nr:DUF6622 family protein [Undibacterium fentianense]MBR7801465.1 hypothetical protein [Undibacterium fentianense]